MKFLLSLLATLALLTPAAKVKERSAKKRVAMTIKAAMQSRAAATATNQVKKGSD